MFLSRRSTFRPPPPLFSTLRSLSSTPSPPSHLSHALNSTAYTNLLRPLLDLTLLGHPLGHSPPSIVAAVAAQSATLAIRPMGPLPHRRATAPTTRLRTLFRSDFALLFAGRSDALRAAITVARQARPEGGKGVVFLRAKEIGFGGLFDAGVGKGSAVSCEVREMGKVARFGFAGIGNLRERLQRGGICCVVVEPVQFDAGIVVSKEGYLENVRAVCSEFNALLVVDERRSAGGGAAGHKNMLVCQKGLEAQADIVLVGGGIVGGVVEFSGMLGYYHGGEGRGMAEVLQKAGSEEEAGAACSPVVCAAVEAGCGVLENNEMAAYRQAAPELGAYWRSRMDFIHPGDEVPDFPSLHVRGQGLVTALSIGGPRTDIASRVVVKMADLGVLAMVQDNVIMMAAPLGVSKIDLKHAASVLRKSLASLSGVKKLFIRKKSEIEKPSKDEGGGKVKKAVQR